MSTRYPQSKERSAELLRLTLGRMATREAALNPVTFAVWYEHLAGQNPALSEAFERACVDDPMLGDASIERLYEQHVVCAREGAASRVGAELDAVMQRMAAAAQSTGTEAGRFGDRLDALAKSLREQSPSAAAEHIDAVHADTARMAGALGTLRQELDSSRGEVDRLRDELQTARAAAMNCPLTGVRNRKGFDDGLESMVSGGEGGMHCLVMLDIDHFKRVNDEHGHVAGDLVLQAVGTVLRHVVTDKRATAARYGGEEFALLLPGSSLAQAMAVAEAVRVAVSRMRLKRRNTEQEVLRVTLSAGVAQWRPGMSGTELVVAADRALYAAKHGGRDRVLAASSTAGTAGQSVDAGAFRHAAAGNNSLPAAHAA